MVLAGNTQPFKHRSTPRTKLGLVEKFMELGHTVHENDSFEAPTPSRRVPQYTAFHWFTVTDDGWTEAGPGGSKKHVEKERGT